MGGDIVDYGSLPAWLAFAAAAWAGWMTFRNLRNANTQLDIAQKTRDRELEHERREQASQVAVWPAPGLYEEALAVNGNNGSELPVFDVVLHVRTASNDQVLHRQPVLAPTSGPATLKGASDALENFCRDVNLGIALIRSGQLHVGLEFTDTSGVRWRRDYDGKLTEA